MKDFKWHQSIPLAELEPSDRPPQTLEQALLAAAKDGSTVRWNEMADGSTQILPAAPKRPPYGSMPRLTREQIARNAFEWARQLGASAPAGYLLMSWENLGEIVRARLEVDELWCRAQEDAP